MPAQHDLGAIVRKYRRDNLARASRELDAFRRMSFDEAVTHAGLSERLDPKSHRWLRYDHQRRIPRTSLEAVLTRLRRAQLKGCRSFHELLSVVHDETSDVPAIGELTVYDTALRIGAHLGLEPEEAYLHCGTRQGARALGLDTQGAWIERNDTVTGHGPDDE